MMKTSQIPFAKDDKIKKNIDDTKIEKVIIKKV